MGLRFRFAGIQIVQPFSKPSQCHMFSNLQNPEPMAVYRPAKLSKPHVGTRPSTQMPKLSEVPLELVFDVLPGDVFVMRNDTWLLF